jgi:tubulin--tyrosine ligase
VDLLLNFPEGEGEGLPMPKVTILEYNASPDFHQSGERLRPKLAEMFQGIIRISIAPFFGLSIDDDNHEQEEGEWEVGTEKWGWRLVGRGQVRGPGI